MADYVYLIGLYFSYGELCILGIYDDEKKLLETYDKLMKEDSRCLDKIHPEIPTIYKIPVNVFLGEDAPWAHPENNGSYFVEENTLQRITIDEIKSHIFLTSFYGFNVYCNLSFDKGPFIDVEYVGGGEEDYCWAQVNIETGEIIGANKYTINLLSDWYKENYQHLIKLYKTREIIELPEWEE
jgi:hypothetical protein